MKKQLKKIEALKWLSQQKGKNYLRELLGPGRIKTLRKKRKEKESIDQYELL